MARSLLHTMPGLISPGKVPPSTERNREAMRFWRLMQSLGRRLLLLTFALLVLLPVAAVGVHAMQSATAENLSLALPWGRRGWLLANSLLLSAVVSVITMAIGTLVASTFHRRRDALAFLVLLLMPVPPAVYAASWTASLHALQSWTGVYGAFPGWIGAAWVEIMSLAPLAVGLAWVGMRSVDPDQIEAARLLACDRAVLSRVWLPAAAPLLVASGGVVFVLSLLDYETPSLFAVHVYAMEIFAELSAGGGVARAFFLAVPLLVLALALLVGCLSSIGRWASMGSTRSPWTNPPTWPPSVRWAHGGARALLLVQIGLPVVTLAVAAWSHQEGVLGATSRAVWAASGEISRTIGASACAAVACLLPALAVARKLQDSRLWWVLVAAPLAVPPSLVGLGLLLVWNRAEVAIVADSPAMLMLAGAARFTPLAALLLQARLRRVDPLLLDAARVIERDPLHAWWRVQLPMLSGGMVAAGALCFALTAGELPATLMVAPPGGATLSMRVYNLLHYGASSEAAVLCLTLLLTCMAAGALAIFSFQRWEAAA